MTTTGYTGHAFTIRVSECKINLAGIRIKNTVNGEYKNRATRKFHVSGFSSRQPWKLEVEFKNPLLEQAPPPELETFYFSNPVEVQILKFHLDSFWGNLGGGLDFFEVVTVSGNIFVNIRYDMLPLDLCKTSEADICPPFPCGTPPPEKRKPAGINCPCSRNCTGKNYSGPSVKMNQFCT